MPWDELDEMANAVRRVARLLLAVISTLDQGFEQDMQVLTGAACISLLCTEKGRAWNLGSVGLELALLEHPGSGNNVEVHGQRWCAAMYGTLVGLGSGAAGTAVLLPANVRLAGITLCSSASSGSGSCRRCWGTCTPTC